MYDDNGDEDNDCFFYLPFPPTIHNQKHFFTGTCEGEGKERVWCASQPCDPPAKTTIGSTTVVGDPLEATTIGAPTIGDPLAVTTIGSTTAGDPLEVTSIENAPGTKEPAVTATDVTLTTVSPGGTPTDPATTVSNTVAADDVSQPDEEPVEVGSEDGEPGETTMKSVVEDLETTTQAEDIPSEGNSTEVAEQEEEEDQEDIAEIDSVTEPDTTATTVTSQPEVLSSSTEPLAVSEVETNEERTEEKDEDEIILFPRDPLLKVIPTTSIPRTEVSTTELPVVANTEPDTTVAGDQKITDRPVTVTETESEETTFAPSGEIMEDDVEDDYLEEEVITSAATTSKTMSDLEETTLIPLDGDETDPGTDTETTLAAVPEKEISENVTTVANDGETTTSSSGVLNDVEEVTTESRGIDIGTEAASTESAPEMSTDDVAMIEDVNEEGLTEMSAVDELVTTESVVTVSENGENDVTVVAVTEAVESEVTVKEDLVVEEETTESSLDGVTEVLLEGVTEPSPKEVIDVAVEEVTEGSEESVTETSEGPTTEIPIAENVTETSTEGADEVNLVTEEVTEEEVTSVKTPADEESAEEEITERTASQKPENTDVTMTTKKTVEDMTEKMEIDDTTKPNMFEIKSTPGVLMMQDTEETTIDPGTFEENSTTEKAASEEEILVLVETTTLTATEAPSQESTEMSINKDDEAEGSEETGRTTVGPIVENADATEPASTVQPELQDDDTGDDEDYQEVTERDAEMTTVTLVSVNEEENENLTRVVVTTASPLLDLLPQTTTVSPDAEDDKAETTEDGVTTSPTVPIQVTTMQPEDVPTTEEGSGSHELLCQEMSTSPPETPADHLPLDCHLVNSTDKRTVTILIDKQKIDIDRLFAKNVKVVVKELMVMDVGTNTSQRRRRRR